MPLEYSEAIFAWMSSSRWHISVSPFWHLGLKQGFRDEVANKGPGLDIRLLVAILKLLADLASLLDAGPQRSPKHAPARVLV